jgi:hypothetical protein
LQAIAARRVKQALACPAYPARVHEGRQCARAVDEFLMGSSLLPC